MAPSRTETLSVKELEKQYKYMKGMEEWCRVHHEYQLETFYHKARIGYQIRLERAKAVQNVD